MIKKGKLFLYFHCVNFLFLGCQQLLLNNPKDPNSVSYLWNQLFERIIAGSQQTSFLNITASRSSRSVLAYTESVTLTASDSSASIYYSLDGSNPNSNSLKYSQALFPSKDFVGKTIRAVASASDGTLGMEISLNYFYPVLRTEQNVCYDTSTNVVSCDSVNHAGQDGLVQTGKSQSYNGPIAHATYPSDIYTIDNNTGLTWQTCINSRTGLSCSGSDVGATWASAQTNCSALDSQNSGLGYAGVTGWRLPTMHEVFTLLRQNASGNSISATNFPATQPSYVLTSTLYPPDTVNSVYNIGFVNQVAVSTTKAATGFYRCVSGPSPPTISLTDTGSGYLSDATTGLSWTKCFPGESVPNCSGSATSQIWTAAISYCANLPLGGKTWRLPNANELVGLIDPTATTAPFIKNANLFSPNLNSKTLFSSTTWVNVGYPNEAIGMTTATGTMNNNIPKGTSYYSLCVSGP